MLITKNVGADIEKTILLGRNIKEKEDVSRHPLFSLVKIYGIILFLLIHYTSTILFQNLLLLFLIESSHGQ